MPGERTKPKTLWGWLVLPVASSRWDGILWGSAVVAVLGIVFSAFVPAASELAVLFSITLFANGPYGAFIPAAQEPILMVFARLYPAVVVAAVATVSATAIEYANYRLFEAAVHSKVLAGARKSPQMQRVVRWFEAQPFLTVAFCALTPIPFVLARIVAAAARYRADRFLLANAIGRFPRFWAYGALGVLVPIATRDILLGGALLSLVLGLWVLIRRRRPLRQGARPLPALD